VIVPELGCACVASGSVKRVDVPGHPHGRVARGQWSVKLLGIDLRSTSKSNSRSEGLEIARPRRSAIVMIVAHRHELWVAALLSLSLGGCGDGGDKPPQQQAVSYASREPGSSAAPTNDTSFQLLNQDPSTRLAFLRSYIVQSGHRCDIVKRGVFESGLDGTDEWRVNCGDTGAWQLWFRPYLAPEAVQCRNRRCG
jgi:hypothetical protein